MSLIFSGTAQLACLPRVVGCYGYRFRHGPGLQGRAGGVDGRAAEVASSSTECVGGEHPQTAFAPGRPAFLHSTEEIQQYKNNASVPKQTGLPSLGPTILVHNREMTAHQSVRVGLVGSYRNW